MSEHLVYSTTYGDMCPGCNQPRGKCACRDIEKNIVVPTDGIARVRLSTKGRNGKGVTLIIGLPLSENDLVKAAKNLKHKLGTGGTVKDKHIEIQGDRVDEVIAELAKQGYQAKRG
jgi:translation initiation factor 1